MSPSSTSRLGLIGSPLRTVVVTLDPEGNEARTESPAHLLRALGHEVIVSGFDLTDEDRYLLYRACYAAFKACKAKGALQEKAGTHT